MSQRSKKGGNPLLISCFSLTSVLPTMRRHNKRSRTEWLLVCQLFLMVVTVVLSTDSHTNNEGSVNSDSELLSHSISNPSSGSNKNVPFTDTHTMHQASENNKPINLTQVWNDVQTFFNTAKNSTDKILGIQKRDTQAVGKNTHAHNEQEHDMNSHEMGMESQHHSDQHETKNQSEPQHNVTHSTMHEHFEHHEHLGEIQPDKMSHDENPSETVRIQDILRQIFVDEIASEGEGSTDEFNEEEEPLLNDTSFRSMNVSQHSSNSSSENSPSTKSRQGRANNGSKKRRNTKGSGDSRGSKKSKGADLAKYNTYMDAVLKRMNSMIKSKRMDPLRVNLYAGPSKKKAGNGNKNKKNSPRMNIDSEEDDGFDEDDSADHGDKEPPGAGPATRDIYLDMDGASRQIRALLSNISSSSTNKPYLLSEHDEERGFSDSTEAESRGPTSPKSGNGTSSSRSKTGVRGGGKKTGKGAPNPKGGSNKNKNSPRPTRGILHGLSTLRRDGNVQVIKQSDKGRLVRAKFLLGPVALEILPKKTNTRGGRGGSQGSRPASATATAPQLKGVLEVRLKQGSPTRIRRLRVYPPGNVKVAGDGKQGGAPSGRVTGRGYNKVTPMATYRLRQVAMQVVRHADRLKQ